MHEPSSNHEPVHTDVSYDKTETNLRPALLAGIGVVVLCLIAYGISQLTFDTFKAKARREPGLSALAKERPQLPQGIDKIPEPRLEVAEPLALERQRRLEEQLLQGSPTWVDAQKGIVRIPIAEAMRLLADPEIAKAKGVRVEAPKGGGQ
jgi:hypothetical protein